MDVCGYQTLQHFAAIPLYAYVTFGKWDEIMNYKKPSDERPYILAVWHYARSVALIAKNNLSEAENEIAELDNFRGNETIDSLLIWGFNSAGILVDIASEVAKGELEAKKKNYSDAIAHLKKAVEYEYSLTYDEPPTWFYPCRQNLGAVLIEAGMFEEAEKIYKENLNEIPENGWGLYGLHQALMSQGKTAEAADVEKRFEEAWKYADIKLTSSRVL
jgi:tetratricopeptide (TPR) repeat protein